MATELDLSCGAAAGFGSMCDSISSGQGGERKGWVSETVVGTQQWRCDCTAPPWCVQDLVASTPFLPEVPPCPCPVEGLHPADLDLCTLWNTEKVWRDKEEKREKGE